MKWFMMGLITTSLILGSIIINARGAAKDDSRIVLSKKNTLAFRDVVTSDSVKNLQREAFKMSSELAPNEPIYLFLHTPGGSVLAGEELISSLQALPQEVKTVTNFAASMGFITVQSLGERLILPNGTLMSHRAAGGAEGQIPGELNSRVEFWTARIRNIESKMAARLGQSLADYEARIVNEYWTSGELAVKDKAADRLVHATCASDLSGEHESTIMTLFGPVHVIWADCPLITTPLGVSFNSLTTTPENANEVERLKEAILRSYRSKAIFVNDTMTRETYLKYVQ